MPLFGDISSVIHIPIQRHVREYEGELFDNGRLQQSLLQEVPDIPASSAILFVDDEIQKGTAARATLRLMRSAWPNRITQERSKYYIVAEGRKDYEEITEIDGISVRNILFPITKPDDYKVITKYFRPSVLNPLIEYMVSRNMNPVRVLNVALEVPVKEYTTGALPFFTNEYNTILAAEYYYLKNVRHAFRKFLRSMIVEILNTEFDS